MKKLRLQYLSQLEMNWLMQFILYDSFEHHSWKVLNLSVHAKKPEMSSKSLATQVVMMQVVHEAILNWLVLSTMTLYIYLHLIVCATFNHVP